MFQLCLGGPSWVEPVLKAAGNSLSNALPQNVGKEYRDKGFEEENS